MGNLSRCARALFLASIPAFFASCASVSSPKGLRSDERIIQTGWYEALRRADRIEVLAGEGHELVLPYIGSGDPELVQAYLDEAERAGIGVILQLPQRLLNEGDQAKLDVFIRRWAGHPAIAMWYLADEPELRSVDPSYMAAASAAIRAADPAAKRLIVYWDAAKGLRLYEGSFDILGIDIYPAFKGMPDRFGLWSLGFRNHVFKAANLARSAGLPFAMVLQGFGQAEDGSDQVGRRQATVAETRNMLWVSVAAGAESLIWWARYRASAAWVEGVLAPELDLFRRVIPAFEAVTIESSSPRSGLDALRIRSADGREHAVFVSSSIFSKTISFTLDKETELLPLSTDRVRWTRAGDTVSLRLPPFGVAIFKLR